MNEQFTEEQIQVTDVKRHSDSLLVRKLQIKLKVVAYFN